MFHTQKAGRKRVVVSTEENLIASLDLRTGGICMLICCLFSIKKTFENFILQYLIFVLRILWFWLFACFMFMGFADKVSWFWVNAVWRHVLGDGDAVDEIDIALGKCNYLHISLNSEL